MASSLILVVRGEHLDRAVETERTVDGKGDRDELGDA